METAATSWTPLFYMGTTTAGQITGVEGYVESAAIGLLAGRFAAAEGLGRESIAPPPPTALGALLTQPARLFLVRGRGGRPPSQNVRV